MEKSPALPSPAQKLSHLVPLLAIFPLLSSCLVILGAFSLLNLVRASYGDDIPVGFGQFTLFYSLAIAAPPSAFLSRAVPQVWVLLGGALVTSFGLLVCAFVSEPGMKISLFASITGFGTSLTFHASYSLISQFYTHNPVCTLLLLMVGLVSTNSALSINAVTSLQQGLVLMGFLMVLACFLPAMLMIRFSSASQKAAHDQASSMSTPLLPTVTMSDAGQTMWFLVRDSGGAPDHALSHLVRVVVLWTWWTLGVNQTLMNDNQSQVTIRIASTQMFLALFTFGAKLVASRYQGCSKVDKSSIGNHFLILGILGICGLAVVVYPAHTDTYHNHLLFSVAYILQVTEFTEEISKVLSLEAGETKRGCQTIEIICQALMMMILAVVFILFVTPIASAVHMFIMSFDLSIACDVILLGVLSCLALSISVIRVGA